MQSRMRQRPLLRREAGACCSQVPPAALRCAVHCCTVLDLLLCAALRCTALHNFAPQQAVCRACAGKVVDVQRQTTGGFARGHLLLEGSGAACAGRVLRILFQNENLLAFEQAAEQEAGTEQQQRLVVAVPDLICCVEVESEPAAAAVVVLCSCVLPAVLL